MRRFMVLVLACCLASILSGCGLRLQNLPVGTGSGSDTYPISIEVSDAAQLPIGGLVRMGQSEIGRIGAINVHNYIARITVNIHHDVRLHKGTKARLQLPSPLGEEYVELVPPKQPDRPRLRAGGVIPRADTSRGPDPEQLLAAVGTLLRGSGITQAKTIVRESNTILHGREGKLRTLLHRLDKMLTNLDRQSKIIDTTLRNLDRLSRYAKDNQSVLNEALEHSRPGIKAILSQKGKFNKLVGKVRSLGQTVDTVVGKNQRDIVEFVDKFQGPLTSLAKLDSHVDEITAGIAKVGPHLEAAVPGDYLTVGMHMNLPDAVLKLVGEIGAGLDRRHTGGPQRLMQAATR